MIQIRGLEKSLDNVPILRGVNLDIKDGETLCVIGKSGCGKSVLLKHIVGLLIPDKGEIAVDGQNISKLPQKQLFKLRSTMGYVFQGAALFDSFNVYENVVLRLYENGEKRREILENEAKFVLSAVGLLPNFEEQDSAEFIREWNVLRNKKPSD